MSCEKKKQFIEVDQFKKAISQLTPPMLMYGSGNIEQALFQQINTAMSNYHFALVAGLTNAIQKSQVDYDRCMLCQTRDHDIKPEDPR